MTASCACSCNGGVNFTMQRDSRKALRYAALQSEAGKKLLQRCGRAPDDISSIVLVEQDACFIKSEAVLRIAQQLDQPFPALASSLLPLPRLVRDAVYDQVHLLMFHICLRIAIACMPLDRRKKPVSLACFAEPSCCV